MSAITSAIKKAAATIIPSSPGSTSKPSSITIPKSAQNGSSHKASDGKTPLKTPQDEAYAFFSGGGDGERVQVWELWLEEDGGPGEGKDVSLVFALGLVVKEVKGRRTGHDSERGRG